MLAFAGLCSFSLYTLFTTHGPIFLLLQLITLPHEFHLELLLLLILNVVLSFGFEEYGAHRVARFIGNTQKRIRRARGRRRDDDHKAYKSIARALES